MRYAWPWLAMALFLIVVCFQLRNQGRSWWCACGQPYPWVSDSQGPHNSQHLFDPYSFTHILHGFLLCWLLVWAVPRWRPAWQLCLAVCVEGLWEVLENSAFVIERYRAATMAQGYTGDTIANSLGDILSCAFGFMLARRLGFWRSCLLFLVTEVVLLLWIHDSLLLDVLMLIHPFEAIKAWQMAR
jgi:hypothetical protein